ncbi:MAG: hypothetical protein KDA28_04910 [Phycisphaerales bacterium]|nr:hypothetical protein [Phycisphaerales bacterium]
MAERLHEDDRFSMIQDALGHERANHPRWVVVVGVIVLVAGAIFASTAWMSRAAAIRDRNASVIRAVKANVLLTRLEEARSRGADPGATWTIDPNLRSKISDYAKQAGMDGNPILPTTNTTRVGDAQRVDHKYDVQSDDIEALIRWVEISTSKIDGLEVSEFRLEVRGTWRLNVTFSRWEPVA